MIEANQARLNVTINGQNGDLPDPILYDATDVDIRQWATEAVRGGGIPGVAADPNVNFRDFVIDRFEANDARPYRLVQLRPKTAFGY